MQGKEPKVTEIILRETIWMFSFISRLIIKAMLSRKCGTSESTNRSKYKMSPEILLQVCSNDLSIKVSKIFDEGSKSFRKKKVFRPIRWGEEEDSQHLIHIIYKNWLSWLTLMKMFKLKHQCFQKKNLGQYLHSLGVDEDLLADGKH